MLWLDLAVSCLLAWGAVTGYHAGWRKSSYSLGGLLCAAAAAFLERADLRIFWAGHSPLEETIAAMVNSRLALPVSGGGGGVLPGLELPAFLREALYTGTTVAAAGNPQLLADMLAEMMSCTAAFLAGFCLWHGFFHLCGMIFSGKKSGSLSGPARWGGALVGLVRQCCCAALLIGTAAPLAWLWGFPSGLLQLERTLLAHWGWQLFACLGIWF
ncbi:MAG TPA: hypothetical protein PKV91_03270 [Bacillota bacterium]|jgi:hypothetical protein|nr:hypothetical protein [Bacillota bacterium]HOA34652.1 hypothetical protein [Bacillota bacterium]HOJ83266.1 hypothetical protein [Bacillota bacterium]HOL16091.1 hypothetical protein [Bacillota bacterium]HPZ11361.1 hypothetical protein [Bacillota bacterium]